MSRSPFEDIVRRFHEALALGDTARLAAVYADDIVVWHTFDRVGQTKEQNLRTLAWMVEHVEGLSYDDIRVAFTDDGFVQQHVFRTTKPPLEVPCMLRAWCRGDRIVRIEEYLDSADTAALADYAAARRATGGRP